MMKKHLIWMLFAAFFVQIGLSSAQTIDLRYVASDLLDDTYIRYELPNFTQGKNNWTWTEIDNESHYNGTYNNNLNMTDTTFYNDTGAANHEHSFYRWNLSFFNSSTTIDDASFCLYQLPEGFGTSDWNISVHLVWNNFTINGGSWTAGIGDGEPSVPGFVNDTCDGTELCWYTKPDVSYVKQEAEETILKSDYFFGRVCFNVTNATQEAISLGYDNMTLLLRSHDVTGISDDEYTRYYSQEASNLEYFLPWMNITYTPGYTFEDALGLLANLTAYWSLDRNGTLTPLIGDKTKLTLKTNTTWPSQQVGIINRSVHFNGTGATCDTCPTLVTNGSHIISYENYTISFWMRDNSTFASQGRILRHYRGLDGTSINLIAISRVDNETIRFGTQYSTGANSWDIDCSLLACDFSDNTWHHVVLRSELVNTSGPWYNKSAYFDGVYLDTINFQSLAPSSQQGHLTSIGSEPDANTTQWNGELDEIGIWSNRSLTHNDIQILYNMGRYVDFIKVNTTIELRYISNESAILNYNVSYNKSSSQGSNASSSFINSTLLIQEYRTNENISNTHNFTFQVLNNSFYPQTNVSYDQFLNQSHTEIVHVYDYVSLILNFRELLFNTTLTGFNISYQVVGANAYNNTVTNGSAVLNVTPNIYTIFAELIDYPEFGPGYLANQNISIASTLEGIIPSFEFYMYFGNTSQTGAQNITLTVSDQDGQTVENATVVLQRYDINSNMFVPISVTRTNFLGQTRFQAVLYDEEYKILIFYDDILRFESERNVFTSTQLEITINLVANLGEGFFIFNNINYLLSFENSTNTVTFEWFNADTDVELFCLNITNIDYYSGNSQTNGSCTTSSSGSIIFNIVNQSGEKFEAKAFVSILGELYLLDSLWIEYPPYNPIISDSNNYVYQVILTGVLVLAFAFDWPLVLPVAGLSLVFGGLLKFNGWPMWINVFVTIVGLSLALWLKRSR